MYMLDRTIPLTLLTTFEVQRVPRRVLSSTRDTVDESTRACHSHIRVVSHADIVTGSAT